MGASCEVSAGQADGGGDGGDVRREVAKSERGQSEPLYTLQALWDGKMTMQDFMVVGKEQPTLPHNVFEQDGALPVVDIGALIGIDREAREANMATMLDAAKTWGFFKIRNHGVPLEVV